jgi:UDP-glucose 4-epimerase
MKKIILTGGSGFVGQFLRRGLRKRGYRVEIFDQYRGWMLNLLRGRYFGTTKSKRVLDFSFWLNDHLCRLESALLKYGYIKPTGDDILDARTALIRRFQGAHAVVHLAGIAHSNLPGMSDSDYRKVNYDGAINVFEAARKANVPKFIFASSVGAYGCNSHFGRIRIERFPVVETNSCPASPEESGSGIYGVMKKRFEDYLAAQCARGGTKAVAFRLDAPGFRVRYSEGFVTSTSIENLVEGFDCALRTEWDFGFEVFNLLDGETDPQTNVDVQRILRETWPDVPNHSSGNVMPFSTNKISLMLGYRPIPNGRYLDEKIVYVKQAGELKRQLALLKRDLISLILPGDAFILADNEPSGLDRVLARRKLIPFLEKEGEYWGLPPDDETAIRELERLRQSGARFILFTASAFWWLDHYTGLRDYLQTKFQCALKTERVVAFNLKAEAARAELTAKCPHDQHEQR